MPHATTEATMSELATYQLEGRIATIRMDDGKVNALSVEMLRTLHDAFDRAERDGAVVVLTGREGFFSAGFDLKVFTREAEEVLEMVTLGATLAERVLSFPRPVLTACSGHTIAAGTFVPLAADLRIGVDGPFQVGLNEVKIGITMPQYALELARQRLAPAHFDRAVVGAAMYSPSEAVTAGFLDRVVPAGELETASTQAAEALAELDPAAHAATKLRARAGALRALRSAIESELNVEALSAAKAQAA
jgi:enoyl-CoA hydratase